MTYLVRVGVKNSRKPLEKFNKSVVIFQNEISYKGRDHKMWNSE